MHATLFRPQRGGYAESMAEVREVESRAEIAWLTGMWVRDIKPYTFDSRNGWDTYVVLGSHSFRDEPGVIGFTNGPLEMELNENAEKVRT